MAYITVEQVKKMRQKIRAEFLTKKGWKISVRRDRCSSVFVDILEAPIKFTDKDYEQVNPYYINDHYQGWPKNALLKIKEIINDGNFDKSDSMTDYYHVGWYAWISIGRWDAPFKQIKK